MSYLLDNNYKNFEELINDLPDIVKKNDLYQVKENINRNYNLKKIFNDKNFIDYLKKLEETKKENIKYLYILFLNRKKLAKKVKKSIFNKQEYFNNNILQNILSLDTYNKIKKLNPINELKEKFYNFDKLIKEKTKFLNFKNIKINNKNINEELKKINEDIQFLNFYIEEFKNYNMKENINIENIAEINELINLNFYENISLNKSFIKKTNSKLTILNILKELKDILEIYQQKLEFLTSTEYKFLKKQILILIQFFNKEKNQDIIQELLELHIPLNEVNYFIGKNELINSNIYFFFELCKLYFIDEELNKNNNNIQSFYHINFENYLDEKIIKKEFLKINELDIKINKIKYIKNINLFGQKVLLKEFVKNKDLIYTNQFYIDINNKGYIQNIRTNNDNYYYKLVKEYNTDKLKYIYYLLNNNDDFSKYLFFKLNNINSNNKTRNKIINRKFNEIFNYLIKNIFNINKECFKDKLSYIEEIIKKEWNISSYLKRYFNINDMKNNVNELLLKYINLFDYLFQKKEFKNILREINKRIYIKEYQDNDLIDEIEFNNLLNKINSYYDNSIISTKENNIKENNNLYQSLDKFLINLKLK